MSAGYTVGVGNVAQTPVGVSWEQRNVVAALAHYWPSTAPANAQYVGTWVGGAVLYIDHVTVIATLNLALSLARKNGERSIYDNARGACIDVPYPVECDECGRTFDDSENAHITVDGEVRTVCDDCRDALTWNDDTEEYERTDSDDAYRATQWRHTGYAYGFVRGAAAYLTPAANVSEWPFDPFETVEDRTDYNDGYADGYADGYDAARAALADCDNDA